MAFIVSVMANLICIYWRFVLKLTHIICGEGQIAACAAAASYICRWARGVIESVTLYSTLKPTSLLHMILSIIHYPTNDINLMAIRPSTFRLNAYLFIT